MFSGSPRWGASNPAIPALLAKTRAKLEAISDGGPKITKIRSQSANGKGENLFLGKPFGIFGKRPEWRVEPSYSHPRANTRGVRGGLRWESGIFSDLGEIAKSGHYLFGTGGGRNWMGRECQSR